MKSDIKHRQLLTHYTPASFLKPIAVFSLLVRSKNNTSELAVCFVEALNFQHALAKLHVSLNCYKRAGWGDPREKITDYKIIGRYRSIEKGLSEFYRIPLNMTFTKYLKFLDKHFEGFEKETKK